MKAAHIPPAPILMVHGAFCGGWVFDLFTRPFVKAGHVVETPDLPGHGARDRREAVAGLSMSIYARFIADEAAKFERPPILIGHSMGGLVSLMAAAQVRTAGVILLAPSAPWGVNGSTMEEAVSAVSLYALGPYWTQAIDPDYTSFSLYGVDRLAEDERKAVFGRMRPESGLALFETLNWWLDPFMTTVVSEEKIRAPVLALAGGRDTVHPPATIRETARRVGGEAEVLAGMSHWLPGEPGWEAVADLCLGWISRAEAGLAAAE